MLAPSLGCQVPDTLQLAARLCADRNASEAARDRCFGATLNRHGNAQLSSWLQFLRARAFSHLHRLGDIVTQMVRPSAFLCCALACPCRSRC